jgi:IMP dehydrogenase/GMP reductase
MKSKFDFNDILIEPAMVSKISSRSEVNPFINGYLPLITAPMDTVVSVDNLYLYNKLKINVCLPRGEFIVDNNVFISYSLDDFIFLYEENLLNRNGSYLIDIANGHMEKLTNHVRLIKELYPTIRLMVGNIANPETYVELSNAGADFIRCGIGNGNACSTTLHTAVGYPMASLIQECYDASCLLDNPAKIVADGGMKTYSDVIKALALGADCVMIGSIFNKAIESCGDNYLFGKIKVNQIIAEKAYKHKIPVYKKFRGMSTKEVQKKWGKQKLTTSEGVIRFRKVEYSLNRWVENFEDYLRSAMSYTDSKTLNEFIGNVKINKITDNAYDRFKK